MKHCVSQTQSYIVECGTVNVMSIASSGMRAATLGVQAAASNVARLPVADPAAPVADLLAAKEAVLAFAANATLIRRNDPMLGALLDERA